MSTDIPTYQLNILGADDEEKLDFYFLNRRVRTSKVRLAIPYRSDFYAVGICLRGTAELRVNLETYAIEPDCLVIKPPHTINQWTAMSDDFETISIFFTREFIAAQSNDTLEKFRFFESAARHVFKITAEQAQNVISSLEFLRRKYEAPEIYQHDILKNLVAMLLYEIASIYDLQNLASNAKQTRGRLLAADFKRLLNENFAAQRNLKFYAGRLFITPKHLTETVKKETGKTAGEWIAEAVTMEAKFLMQNPSLSIDRISEMLHFADQSTFGKYFKNHTGLSPSAFKQTL